MSNAPTVTPTAIGVGFDTARYGHCAAFLREDRQSAAQPLEFLEARSGYRQLEQAFRKLADKHPNIHFYIRVDAAGQYATNLLAFLQQLPWPKTISVGQPMRNKQYRQVHFPKRKADLTESLACARFALLERPPASPTVPAEMLTLREIASRLEFQVKQSTRQVNRLHNLLARVFPELATLQNDLTARWVLRLLDKYPTAERLAHARLSSLTAIPHLSAEKARPLLAAAAQSVAAERGPLLEQLVRQSVQGLQASLQAEAELEKLLLQAFDALPDKRVHQIPSIPGIGPRTAAVLVANIISLTRFPTADHLTSYFGLFPEECTSGVDKFGQPLPPGTRHMSRQGNDLVRKHLWMAAFSAITSNAQVKDLYARLRAKGRRGDVALGHCMRKLLHQVFGIWSSGRPYDPQYRSPKAAAATPSPTQEKVAGRNTGNIPPRTAVTATCSTIDAPTQTVNPVSQAPSPTPAVLSPNASGSIDFPYLRSQITMERVLRHLGYFDRLRSSGQQRRGPCPIHGSKRDRGRSFSAHLGKNVFQCFHPPCGAAGNVLDLWCAVHHLTPYEGALHLAQTFALQLHPEQTEKRNP